MNPLNEAERRQARIERRSAIIRVHWGAIETTIGHILAGRRLAISGLPSRFALTGISEHFAFEANELAIRIVSPELAPIPADQDLPDITDGIRISVIESEPVAPLPNESYVFVGTTAEVQYKPR